MVHIGLIKKLFFFKLIHFVIGINLFLDYMDAGETMVEVIRPSNITSETHEGIKQYYIQKIEELQVR